jgi:hypothetical protein
MMLADAKYIEPHLISERDRFEQLAEVSRWIDGATARVNGCRYETVYADFHMCNPRKSPRLFFPAGS